MLERQTPKSAQHTDQRATDDADGQGAMGDVSQLGVQTDLAGLPGRHRHGAPHLRTRSDGGHHRQRGARKHCAAAEEHALAFGERSARGGADTL